MLLFPGTLSVLGAPMPGPGIVSLFLLSSQWADSAQGRGLAEHPGQKTRKRQAMMQTAQTGT
jgi:hypothetical protein